MIYYFYIRNNFSSIKFWFLWFTPIKSYENKDTYWKISFGSGIKCNHTRNLEAFPF